jgi:hypothetical protein
MIGFNEVASNFRFGHAVTKTCPLLWEENANSTGYPVELPGCVVATLTSTISVTRWGCRSA